MAYTFAKAQGGRIGNSLLEADKQEFALEMIQKAKDRGVKLLLPSDTLAAKEFSPTAAPVVVDTMIPQSSSPKRPTITAIKALDTTCDVFLANRHTSGVMMHPKTQAPINVAVAAVNVSGAASGVNASMEA